METSQYIVSLMKNVLNDKRPSIRRWLQENNALFQNGIKRLSDGTLVAITLMIAESKPDEKDIMVKLVMNLLNL